MYRRFIPHCAFATGVTALVLAVLIATPSANSLAGASPVEFRLHPVLEGSLDGKGIRRGIYDGYQINPLQPSHWYFVDDDPADGSGLMYGIYDTSYVEPGPANPSVTNNIQLITGVNPTTLQEAVDFIVQNNAHVQSAAQLLVHKHVISLP